MQKSAMRASQPMNDEQQAENEADWVRRVSGHFGAAATRMDRSARKRYKMSLLISCARRVAAFRPGCEECRSLQQRIDRLAEEVGSPPGLSRARVMNHLDVVKAATRHLRRNHHLVSKQHYVKSMLVVAGAIGISTVVVGLVLLNLGIGVLVLNVTLPALAFRIVFGYTIGRLLDRRAKRRGLVI